MRMQIELASASETQTQKGVENQENFSAPPRKALSASDLSFSLSLPKRKWSLSAETTDLYRSMACVRESKKLEFGVHICYRSFEVLIIRVASRSMVSHREVYVLAVETELQQSVSQWKPDILAYHREGHLTPTQIETFDCQPLSCREVSMIENLSLLRILLTHF